MDNKVIQKILYIMALLISLKLMDFNQGMSSYWIGPYLSAASNFDFTSFSTTVNFDDIKQFGLLSKGLQNAYNFPSSGQTTEYNYLAKGFLFILILSKKLFFFLGDLEGVRYLQYILHIFIVLSMMNLLNKRHMKITFFILYGINPIILYFVNYPYYYFWQVIPSYLFIHYYLKNKKINNKIFFFTMIFIIIYFARPTVLFLVILFYLVYGYRESWKKTLIAFIIFIGFLFGLKPNGMGPWHTMYVGIGAYSNSYSINLDDTSGYKYFYKTSGKVMNSVVIANKKLRQEYYNALKKEYYNILLNNPALILRNALLNTLQSYSIGYKVGNKYIIYFSILSGFIMIILLLYTKQYLLFLAIGMASASFTLYFPPIAAYMFGSYILIIISFIRIIEYFQIRKYI